MDIDNSQNNSDPLNNDFSQLEKMLSDAQEKLAKYQQKQAEKHNRIVESNHDKAIQPEENPFMMLCNSLPADHFPLGYYSQSTEPIFLHMDNWHRLGVYIGQKNLTRNALANILTAANHTNMQVICLRKKLFTEFNADLFRYAKLAPGDASFWNSDASGIEILTRVLHREIYNQNKLRDEFCLKQDLPTNKSQRVKTISSYIRQQTRPLLILFESISDLICSGASNDILEALRLYLTCSGAYNIYFIGMFSPDDSEEVWHSSLTHAFIDAGRILLIGDCIDKQSLVSVPAEIIKAQDNLIFWNGTDYILGTMPSSGLRTDFDEFYNVLHELMLETASCEETINPSTDEKEK